MSRTGAQWDDYEQDREHKARRIAKLQRIQGLKDLLETWDGSERQKHHLHEDHEYVLKLRARLRAAQNQLDAMAV